MANDQADPSFEAEFGRLEAAIRELNSVISDPQTPTRTARKAQRIRNAARAELLEIVERDLRRSAQPYTVLNGPEFRAITRDMLDLKEDIERLAQGAQRFAQLLSWLGRIVTLL